MLGKIIIGGLVSTVVGKKIEKDNELKEEKIRLEKQKLEIEREKNRNEIKERERERKLLAEERKQLAEEREKERHYALVNNINQARMQNPLNTVCPNCNADRVVDRIKGIISCPYCLGEEPLPQVHCYNAAVDGPAPKTTAITQTTQVVSNVKWARQATISFIFGIISLITLGCLFFPEAISIYLWYKIYKQEKEFPGSIDAETKKKAKKGLIFSVIAIILFAVAMSS